MNAVHESQGEIPDTTTAPPAKKCFKRSFSNLSQAASIDLSGSPCKRAASLPASLQSKEEVEEKDVFDDTQHSQTAVEDEQTATQELEELLEELATASQPEYCTSQLAIPENSQDE
eukprot:4870442-Amphidinium_carterae.1